MTVKKAEHSPFRLHLVKHRPCSLPAQRAPVLVKYRKWEALEEYGNDNFHVICNSCLIYVRQQRNGIWIYQYQIDVAAFIS